MAGCPRSICGVSTASSGPTRPPLVVLNPHASGLADANRRERLRHDLDRRLGERFGIAPEFAEETVEGARASLQGPDDRPLVVVAGGDGTVREVASAMAGSDTPLAIVPAGTGNVLAGALRIRGFGPALELLSAGETRQLDLGQASWAGADGVVHERPFTVGVGMGFDARIMAAAEHEWKRRLRFGAYIGAAVRELSRLESARFRVVADGVTLETEGLLVLIANCGDLIPGRLGARQPLDPADGRLDLLIVGGRNMLHGLRGAIDLLWRTDDSDDHVIRRTVTTVRVEADPPQPIQTDGDHHPPGWLEATVRPGALKVVVPST